MNAPLDRVSAIVTRIESVLMLVFTTGALVTGIMQIVLRYVLNTGFPWSEGVIIVFTIWAAMIGSSRALRDGIHIRLDVLETILTARIRLFLEVASLVVCAAYGLFVCYAGILYVNFLASAGVLSIEAQIPEWIINLIVPIAMALFAYRSVDRIRLVCTRGLGGAHTGGAGA